MALRILVVDDDSTVRGLIASTLRRRGAEVSEAEAAAPALDRLRDDAFDVLVTNLEMPGRSGIWLLEEAKKHRADLPVVVVTGGIPEGEEAELLDLAATVILKPFPLNTLYERVCGALDGDPPHEA